MNQPTTAPVKLSDSSVAAIAARARKASRVLAQLSAAVRNEVLLALAVAIESSARRILEANERDCRAAKEEVKAGHMTSAMLARLRVRTWRHPDGHADP